MKAEKLTRLLLIAGTFAGNVACAPIDSPTSDHSPTATQPNTILVTPPTTYDLSHPDSILTLEPTPTEVVMDSEPLELPEVPDDPLTTFESYGDDLLERVTEPTRLYFLPNISVYDLTGGSLAAINSSYLKELVERFHLEDETIHLVFSPPEVDPQTGTLKEREVEIVDQNQVRITFYLNLLLSPFNATVEEERLAKEIEITCAMPITLLSVQQQLHFAEDPSTATQTYEDLMNNCRELLTMVPERPVVFLFPSPPPRLTHSKQTPSIS